MGRGGRRAAGALALACLLGGPAAAQAPMLDGFDQAMLARRTADFGRRSRDALALYTAARMLNEVPVRDAPGTDAADAAFTPQGLLDEARALAAPELLPMLTLPARKRGVLKSPFGQGLLRTVREVGPRTVYTFPVQAKPGEPLKIGAIGDARTRMALKLSSARGEVLCLDETGDYAPVCTVRAAQAGELRVEVQNRGDAATRAVILSN